jgi:hypothetical protein
MMPAIRRHPVDALEPATRAAIVALGDVLDDLRDRLGEIRDLLHGDPCPQRLDLPAVTAAVAKTVAEAKAMGELCGYPAGVWDDQ